MRLHRISLLFPLLLLCACVTPELSPLDSSTSSIFSTASTSSIASFKEPLPDARSRVTKKPFGIFITPATSPVQPERFSGFHSGTDFEVLPSEQDADVVVSAVCTGPVRQKRFASGYGGVVTQACTLDGQPVTVIYGHLALASITAVVGDTLTAGDRLGLLGKGGTAQTDGERTHLHLGIHRGNAATVAGYVQSKQSLTDWIDPLSVLP